MCFNFPLFWPLGLCIYASRFTVTRTGSLAKDNLRSVYLSACLLVCLHDSLPVRFCLSVCLCICFPVFFMFICLLVSGWLYSLWTMQSLSLNTDLNSVFFFVCVLVCLSLSVRLLLCLSVMSVISTMPVCLSLSPFSSHNCQYQIHIYLRSVSCLQIGILAIRVEFNFFRI